MRVGIVGSRRRTDRAVVVDFVAMLPAGTVVVSGGAAGPDTWAEDAARARGLPVVIHRPNLSGVRGRGEATRRYYERNERIAADCDVLVAFVAPDRKGGTENTIGHAQRLGKRVEIL